MILKKKKKELPLKRFISHEFTSWNSCGAFSHLITWTLVFPTYTIPCLLFFLGCWQQTIQNNYFDGVPSWNALKSHLKLAPLEYLLCTCLDSHDVCSWTMINYWRNHLRGWSCCTGTLPGAMASLEEKPWSWWWKKKILLGQHLPSQGILLLLCPTSLVQAVNK